MACFHPITAWQLPRGCIIPVATKQGSLVNRSIVFDKRFSSIEGVEEIKLPCGRCVGCRLERSKQWAVRICHEKQLHDSCCFITLTYDDKHLPKGNTLKQEDMTLFIKRLRKALDHPIRYFYCGEYGSRTQRPHYHMCLFGENFIDSRKFYTSNFRGDVLYTSPFLEKIWQKGWCPFGDLTFDSAAYTARYILKKVNGPIAEEHYKGRSPEFICMSRRPGIGADWFKKFETDVTTTDSVRLSRYNIRCQPPRYYDKLFKEFHRGDISKLLEFEDRKQRRIEKGKEKA